MSAVDNARAALGNYESWDGDTPHIEELEGQIARDHAHALATRLRDLIAEHERLTTVSDESVDRAAQSLTGLTDELWSSNRREPHVAYYFDAARTALEAALKPHEPHRSGWR